MSPAKPSLPTHRQGRGAGRHVDGSPPRYLLLVALLALPPSCAGERTPARASPPAPTATPREQHTAAPEELRWGRLQLPALAASIELADAARFRLESTRDWTRLRHLPTDSLLELSLTRAERLVRPADCEARARLMRADLPAPEGEEVVDRQRLAVPAGFTSELVVSVETLPGGENVQGHVLAFGAAISRCFALHYVTRTTGAAAPVEVARRLQSVVTRVLPSLRFREPDQRVAPVRLP
ncbi:MAG TPA: hypothetical protein VER33_27335 [Polyangiaceae bacterium]|nr:hypothetical protein [Polyangiaceae bacterium]